MSHLPCLAIIGRRLHAAARNTAATLLLSSLLLSPAFAATFQVSNADNAGNGSLRQALLDAGAAASPPHSIIFSAAYPVGAVITLQSALPSWGNGQLSINGNSRAPVIDGASSFAILDVGAGGTSLSVSGLNLRNGARTAFGGCIALQVLDQVASLAVSGSRFQNCRAISAGGPRGGAIRWEAGSGASVSIQDSVFVQNRTVAIVSGGTIPGGAGGALRVQATTIALQRNLFLENSIDVGAATSGGAGGAVSAVLHSGGTGEVLESEFRSNSATPLTADGLGTGGGLNFSCAGPCHWTIERNYLRGNSARQGGAIWGPGVFGGSSSQKTMTMINNTFVNNDVLDAGGALFFSSGAPRLQHNSFFGNGAASGAHLLISNTAVLEVANNLLAAVNNGSACAGNASGGAVIIGNVSSSNCVLAGSALLNYPGMPAPLIDEAGPGILSFAGDSIIIDTVSGPATVYCPAVDARGNARPVDGDADGVAACDVGAYEHPSPIVFRNGFED